RSGELGSNQAPSHSSLPDDGRHVVSIVEERQQVELCAESPFPFGRRLRGAAQEENDAPDDHLQESIHVVSPRNRPPLPGRSSSTVSIRRPEWIGKRVRRIWASRPAVSSRGSRKNVTRWPLHRGILSVGGSCNVLSLRASGIHD